MKTLKIPDVRKQIYFGLDPRDDQMARWIQNCKSMKASRAERESARLRALQQIALRIELARKFKDWYNHVNCKQLVKRYRLERALRTWRQSWMMKRYTVLEALLNNGKHFLRKRFNRWYEVTLFLRSVQHRNLVLKKTCFGLWVSLWMRGRFGLLGKYVNLWKDWLSRLRTLKKLGVFTKFLPRSMFLLWKALTFRKVDMTSLLEAINRRTLRDVFTYLRDTADAASDRRLLEGLPGRPPGHPETIQPTPAIARTPSPPRRRKPTRKAALDTSRPSCICVLNVCRGGRCECTFETHFSRRLALCFDEVKGAAQDKEVAKEIIRQSAKAHALSTQHQSKDSLFGTPDNRRMFRQPPIDSLHSPNMASQSERPPKPIHRRKPIPSKRSCGTPRRRSFDPLVTPRASAEMVPVLGNTPDASEDGSIYSLDYDFEDTASRDERGSMGPVSLSTNVLSMPATAVVAVTRPAHAAELSPERIKRKAGKIVRGTLPPKPLSHWAFE